jgi:glycosyltransferase involved in cell wall biosynthesis
MARVVLADDGIEFDGESTASRPLGGAESAVVDLTRALAKRGHEVVVWNKCRSAKVTDGVTWTPIAENGANIAERADLYIANRGDKLLRLLPEARAVAFWTHNPAGYLLKWRYLWKLWHRRPTIVFIGDYHASTCPGWVPDGGRAVIPYGISDVFLSARPADRPPAPRAIFTSNPLRSLAWLLDLWAHRIHPRVPNAELHVFSGAQTYGAAGDAKAGAMENAMKRARALKASGVVVHAPVPKPRLVEELRASRVMLYRGDPNETFCSAVGEAQAMGVPAVVQRLGSVVERVRDGETGFVTENDSDFVESAIALLTDDSVWQRQHAGALVAGRAWSWANAAEAFERLIP